jgi:hypothetical protein
VQIDYFLIGLLVTAVVYQIDSELVGKTQSCALPDVYDNSVIYDHAYDRNHISDQCLWYSQRGFGFL